MVCQKLLCVLNPHLEFYPGLLSGKVKTSQPQTTKTKQTRRPCAGWRQAGPVPPLCQPSQVKPPSPSLYFPICKTVSGSIFPGDSSLLPKGLRPRAWDPPGTLTSSPQAGPEPTCLSPQPHPSGLHPSLLLSPLLPQKTGIPQQPQGL